MKLLIPILFSLSVAFALVFTPIVLGEGEDSVHEEVTEQLAEKSNGETIKVIVRLEEGHEDEDVRAMKVDTGSFSIASTSIEDLGEVENELKSVEGFSIEVTKEELETLAKQDFVESIEPVYFMKASLTQSNALINATTTNLQQVNGVNLTGEGITVCVLDTGINYTHESFGGCAQTSNINTAGCAKVIGGHDFVNDDEDPYDDQGHGTHVSGIIAANGSIVGVAPGAKIVSIKVLDNLGGGTSDDIIAGIDWCVANATALNISVISMSLGSVTLFSSACDASDPSMAAAINSAVAQNISVIAATGNDASLTGIGDPSCITNATSIAASYDANVGGIGYSSCSDLSTWQDKVACFSNRNSITDFMAPGSLITSTGISGSTSVQAGTSQAAPQVSGLYAILYQKYNSIFGTFPNTSYLFDVVNQSSLEIVGNGTDTLDFRRVDVLSAVNQFNASTEPINEIVNLQETNDTIYSLNKIYQFNATVNNVTNITNVVLQFGGTDFNSTLLNSSKYQVNITDLSVGDYNYSWRMDDELNNQTYSENRTFTITKSNSNISLSFSTGNSTTIGTGITVSLITNEGDPTGVLNLTRDDVSVNSTNVSVATENIILPIGSYNYSGTYLESENFTSSNLNETFTVHPLTTSLQILFNGTSGNVTFDHGDIVNITGQINTTNTSVVVDLFANFTGASELIASENNPVNITNTSTLDIGIYNITAVYNGSNVNFTSSLDSVFLIIRNVFVNDSVNINANETVIVNGSKTNSSIEFLLNDSVIGNSTSITIGNDLPAGTGIVPNFGIGKFLAIEASQNLQDRITYAVIRHYYQDSDIPSTVNESSLRLYRWNGTEWNIFNGSDLGGVNETENFVFANVTGFSNFTISGTLANGETCSASSQCSSGNCLSGVCVLIGDSICSTGEHCANSADCACASGEECESNMCVVPSSSESSSGGGGGGGGGGSSSSTTTTASSTTSSSATTSDSTPAPTPEPVTTNDDTTSNDAIDLNESFAVEETNQTTTILNFESLQEVFENPVNIAGAVAGIAIVGVTLFMFFSRSKKDEIGRKRIVIKKEKKKIKMGKEF